MSSIERRDFLKIFGIGGAAIATGSLSGIASVFGDDRAALDDVLTGFEALKPPKTVFETSFEPGDVIPQLTAHELVTGIARTGKRSIVGEIHRQEEACKLLVPLKLQRSKLYRFSFFARADNGSACAVWITKGTDRNSLRRVDRVSRKWTHVKGSFFADADEEVVLEIVGPSSWNANPGKMWIDDVVIMEEAGLPKWPPHVQSFPAITADRAGALWLATLDRPQGQPVINVYSFGDGERTSLKTIDAGELTAVAPPAIAPLDSGCVVAFAFERDDKWRIAYSFVEPAGETQPRSRVLETAGSSNIWPTVATVDDTACILWESNDGAARGIYAARVTRDGADRPQRISADEHNSYNPDVVALGNGSIFAAWDSVRSDSADIYGAELRNGQWSAERRLTSNPRIERHPHLAARGNDVWMAWQAQTYPKMKLNFVNEQRVVIARLNGDALEAPIGLFETVSRRQSKLMRPRIAFDPAGRLWLTARESIAMQAGWLPLIWCYDGAEWTDRQELLSVQGRWQPVDMEFDGDSVVTTVQYDNLPKTWTEQGEHVPWKSGVSLIAHPMEQASGPVSLATEPLGMPQTDFSLAAKRDLVAADLPPQQVAHAGRELTLYWGDFHDHTDLSVCQRQTNPPGHDLFANLREIDQLDFCACTDHGYNFDWQQWDFNGAQTRANHDAGRFVTFLGEEWTSSKNPPENADQPVGKGNARRYGHHNIVFLDPYHQRCYDAFDGDISPADLWETLQGVEFLCIPHQLADWKGKGSGNPPTDWSFHDEHLQPVAEIFQARESYEYYGCPRQAPQGAPFGGYYYLQDAWAKGLIIGTIASPDHGGGNGKIGVWAEDLNRRAIFAAIRARHTFGTSGAKMALLLRAGDAMMGDRVPRREGSITFRVKVVAKRPIQELVIFRNNEIVHRIEPNESEFEDNWIDAARPEDEVLWYYARIHAADDELAWSSPIWFV